MAIFLAPSGLRALLIDPLWTSTTAYPGGNFSAGSCVTYAGHLFCVGGDNDSNVWHAPITPVGVDAWQQTSAYGEGGQNIFLSCAAANGYIYCVGGSNLGGFSGDVNSDVWYAPISANGIGQWQQTTLYGFPVVAVTGTKAGVPIWSHSCTINDGYLYCVGGFIRQYQIVATQNGSVSVPFDNPTARVYSAPIENDGSIGFWQQTTSYGQTIAGHSCVTNDGYIYCVGGTSGNGLSDSDTSAVWYAQFLPNGGLTQWNQTTGYGGGAVDGLSCTAAEGRIFCTGGNSQQVWSASLSSAGVGAWTQQTDYPEAIWSPSCVSQKSEVICVGGGQGGGSPRVKFTSYASSVTIQDANSCDAIDGQWDGPSQTCTLHSQLETLNGATLTVPPGVTLHIASDGAFADSGGQFEIQSGATVINDGDLLAGPVDNNGNLVNNNFINVSTPNFQNKGTLTNGGTIQMGNVSLSNSGTIYEGCSGKITGTVSGNQPVSTCVPVNIAVTFNPPSTVYGGQVTVTVTITDSSSAPTPFTAPVAMDDQNTGGTFGPQSCSQQVGTLTCTMTYTAPFGVDTVPVSAWYADGTHQRKQGTGLLTLIGAPTTVTITSLTNPSVFGQPVSFRASITPFDGGAGSVSFASDGIGFGAAGVSTNNTAFISTASLPVGMHTITGSFSGGFSLNGNFERLAPGQGTMAQPQQVIGDLKDQASCQGLGGTWTADTRTCTTKSLTVTNANSFQIESGITLANTDGAVAVQSGGIIQNLGTITNSGRQSLIQASSLAVFAGGVITNQGTVQNGAAIFVAAGATFSNNGTINNQCGGATAGAIAGAAPVDLCDVTTTVLSPKPASVLTGSTTTFTATVTDAVHANNPPTATVFWSANGATFALCTPANGSCSVSYNASATTDSVTIAATFAPPFGGDATHKTSADSFTMLVLPPSTIAVVGPGAPVPFGQPATFVATMEPSTATGAVTFYDGTSPIGIARLVGGAASLTTSALTSGKHSVMVRYTGDANNAPSSSAAIAQVIAPNPQTGFAAPAPSAADLELLSIAMADLNGDGFADLAIANGNKDAVKIWLGNSDGTFTAGGSYPTGAYSTSLAAGDFNSDGCPDLAVSNGGTNQGTSVGVFIGKCDGTFSTVVRVGPNGPADNVRVGDFNGDGHEDIAFLAGDRTVQVLPGNGDGSFGPAHASSFHYGVMGFETGDFNNDGITDVAANDGGLMTVGIGNGDGTFHMAGSGTILINPLNINSIVMPVIAVGDFDGDGNLDMAASADDQISVFLGDGAGNLQPGVPYALAPIAGPAIAADVDGDGHADLVVASFVTFQLGNGVIQVLRGNGDGTFQAPVSYALDAPFYPFAITAGDVNGDGFLDLLTTNIGGGAAGLEVLLGVGQAPVSITWAAPTAITYGTPLGATQLDAIASVPGTFSYSPAAGAILGAGTQTLTATFTPADPSRYATATATVSLIVNAATPVIHWASPAAITYGTPLDRAELNATADVAGTFDYAPGAGTILVAGPNQPLSVIFTPTDAANYAAASAEVFLTVNSAAPIVSLIGAPVSAGYGATFVVSAATNASSAASLAATGACSIAGTTVSMTSGTGVCTISASWPADANYLAASATQSTVATKIAPTVAFSGAPASAAFGSSFVVATSTNSSGTANLAASGACSIAGTTATMTSGSGVCTLTASWAADDNYLDASASQSTTAAKIAPTVTFTGAPANAPYNGSFAVAAVTNASSSATIIGAGACAVAGSLVAMTSGTGTCALTAAWDADANYLAASLTQSTAATKIAPAVTFTGAPATATFGSVFNVAATSNAGVTPDVTAAGACSLSGGAVTMTSGSGSCTLTAMWPATSNYLSVSLTQATAAARVVPVITWPMPAAIAYGTPLGGAQFDATANVAGAFAYSPSAGTILPIGSTPLAVTFMPADTADYAPASATASITVFVTIDSLSGQVNALGATLNAGAINSLMSKLTAARGELQAMVNQLGAFINEVQAMERSGRLDAAMGGELITAAQWLIAHP